MDGEPAQLPFFPAAESGFVPPPPKPPPVISDHQLLRCIGRGSYGEVWLARNALGAYRAVKVVYRDAFKDQRPFERELAGIRKYEPISRSHEGLIDVLHVGYSPSAGYFYYVMELGDGLEGGPPLDPEAYVPQTLSRELGTKGRLPLDRCLQLGLSLSSALGNLHEQGLVHRDVKPSNIIFVGGVPKLADMGLVAGIDEARSYVGTEGFIPPEGPGSPQADIYSLGKVLYEASTGLDRHEFPALPQKLAEWPEAEGLVELNEVILQACQPQAAQRYPSAREMHGDLVVLTNGRSVRRLRTLEKRWSSFKRLTAIGALVALVLGVAFFQVNRELRLASDSRLRQVGAQVGVGSEMMERGDLLGALGAYADALRLDPDNPQRVRTHRLRVAAVLEQSPKLVQMWAAPLQLREGWFSPDGRSVLLVEESGKARTYDLATGLPAATAFAAGELLYRAAFSPDSQFVVTAQFNGYASVWEVTTGERKLRLAHPDKVFCARYSAAGDRIVTACRDGKVRIWDARTGAKQLEVKAHPTAALSAVFSPDGKRFASTSRDETARVWDAATGEPVSPPLPHGNWVDYAAFSPDGRRLVTVCQDQRARVWDALSGRKLLPDLLHGDVVTSCEWSPDGGLIVTSCMDNQARIWEAETGQLSELNPILKHSDRLLHASFAPDGHRVITSSLDGTARVWDLAGAGRQPVRIRATPSRDRSHVATFVGREIEVVDLASARTNRLTAAGPLKDVVLNGDGSFALAGCVRDQTNVTLEWLPVHESGLGASIVPYSGALSNLVLSDPGNYLAAVEGKDIRLFGRESDQWSTRVLTHPDAVEGIRFSPNAAWLATWTSNRVTVWNVQAGRTAFAPLEHDAPVRSVEFSREGRYLGVACADIFLNRCTAQVWSLMSGKKVGAPLPHSDGVLSIAFSADGSRVVTAGEDFAAVVWETTTGRQVTRPMRHGNQIQHASFSADGKWVATASSDWTARVWDAETGDPLTPRLKAPGSLWRVEFLAGAARLVAANRLDDSLVWDLGVEGRSADELLQLSELLNGKRHQGEIPLTTWQRLRDRFPDDFRCSDLEVANWHAGRASFYEMEKQWAVCVVHLERLRALRPDDLELKDRLAKVQDQLRQDQAK